MKPIVHMIWLGSPLRGEHLDNIFTYEDFGYTVNLHTEPLENMVNRDIYDAMTTWAGKADVLRLEILHQLGGLYTDIDSRMLATFPIEKNLVCVKSPSGFIANETIYAEKGHPAIEEAVMSMNGHVKKLIESGQPVNLWDISGATYIAPIFRKYERKELRRNKVGKAREMPSIIIHDYEASWNSSFKSDKKPLSHWLDTEKLGDI